MLELEDKKARIDKELTDTNRLKLIWMWSKQNLISFKEFESLINYFNHFYNR